MLKKAAILTALTFILSTLNAHEECATTTQDTITEETTTECPGTLLAFSDVDTSDVDNSDVDNSDVDTSDVEEDEEDLLAACKCGDDCECGETKETNLASCPSCTEETEVTTPETETQLASCPCTEETETPETETQLASCPCTEETAETTETEVELASCDEDTEAKIEEETLFSCEGEWNQDEEMKELLLANNDTCESCNDRSKGGRKK